MSDTKYMAEFRKDPVSGDWIVVAPERAGRPHGFSDGKSRRRPTPKKTCPFEDLEKTGNWPPIIAYPNRESWRVVLIPNKYPALRHSNVCVKSINLGPYETMPGIGYHDLVVTRDHENNFSRLSLSEALRIFLIFQERYRGIKKDKCLTYVSAFSNWGASAGASLYHPHYQLLALPIVPPEVSHSLRGSHEYFTKKRRCAHCDIIKHERKGGKSIIAENKDAIAFAPFASRHPYKIRIFPKKHYAFFEETDEKPLRAVAELLQRVLKKIEKNLNDPDYNFFIHTAPLKNQKSHSHYHWHVEVIPKMAQEGGFELGTGVDINVVPPEELARILK
ncbi:MAG: DUF4921 family protein [Patescibacteria group bacterium]